MTIYYIYYWSQFREQEKDFLYTNRAVKTF